MSSRFQVNVSVNDERLSELQPLHCPDFWRNAMSIYVGNLSYAVTQEDLAQVFADYGTVKNVTLPIDRETGRMRGFAFVEMDSSDEETAAIDALDGAEWMGRDLRVSKARPKEDRRSNGNRDSFSRSGGGRRF
jgi:RNA recognition motif-containing protein